ncbi:hypothetical protein GF359_09605 [candidate division WOR-3 bacterium]|uniref:Uncharacterized protein n=1 Tax=candidate division WOR-3 bacterium TaxID=2052148 RepID=A0A9D5KB18_UNCW3|nr:hypothetical protein [candidate division WOR-3 bacterium]MBD3365454.1 hypothetical protein [candidate division WOR-3 bacterium]
MVTIKFPLVAASRLTIPLTEEIAPFRRTRSDDDYGVKVCGSAVTGP